MKRTVIKLGGSTNVVSLPKDWTERFGVCSGDEVDVEEKGRELVIRTHSEKDKKPLHVDIQSLQSLVNYGLLALYVRGHDELEIISTKPEQILRLQDHPINQLIGFEIIEQSKNRLLVKDVSGTKDVDIHGLLRMLFLLVLSSSEETIEAISKTETDLSHVLAIDIQINRFCFLCLRLLNKRGYDDYRYTSLVYSQVGLLETIGDEYKHIAQYIIKKKLKIDKPLIAHFEKIDKLLHDYYAVFFKFDIGKAAEIDVRYRNLETEFEEVIAHAKPGQVRVIMHIQRVADLIATMLRAQLIMGL